MSVEVGVSEGVAVVSTGDGSGVGAGAGGAAGADWGDQSTEPEWLPATGNLASC